jgi:hypothetical protein
MPKKHPISKDGLWGYHLRQSSLPVSYISPIWRSYLDIPADAEASYASSLSSFSLTTLQVACNPGVRSFALIERKQPDTWRWAIAGAAGLITDEGWETTDANAKRSAVEALQCATERASIQSALHFENRGSMFREMG